MDFDAEVTITVADGRRANGKSLLELLAMAVQGGTEISITTDGSDEQEAMDTICALAEEHFGMTYDD